MKRNIIMEKTYNFSGTCSRNVTFDIDENHVVTNIRFNGGCNGNLKGVAALCDGMKASRPVRKVTSKGACGKIAAFTV